ncbi:GNAT family N-acetyltransferase [Streptococcaceae bacterium ESL0729]|nr:GNAT family N-acetyltransferase [Streptococcaceae bacterium ESL0729]
MIYLKPARQEDIFQIMELIDSARTFLKSQGIDQWQGDYPSIDDIQMDLREDHTSPYALLVDGQLAGYCVMIEGPEEAYEKISEGKWQGDKAYTSIHRIAIHDSFRGQGLMTYMWSNIFALASNQGFEDIRVDTHPANKIMQAALVKAGFNYQGVVKFEGKRLAYQCILDN